MSTSSIQIETTKLLENQVSDTIASTMNNEIVLGETALSSHDSTVSGDELDVNKLSVSENSPETNDLTDLEKSSCTNSTVLKDAANTNTYSLVNNNNCTTNDISNSENDPLSEGRNFEINNASNSVNIPLQSCNNTISKEMLNFEETPVKKTKNNNAEILINAPDSENFPVNDSSDSEENSLLADNIVVSNDVSDSESSRESNCDTNSDHTNEAQITNPDSSVSQNSICKTSNTKTNDIIYEFEARRHEYEQVLTQCKVNLETLGKENISLRCEVADLKSKLNHQDIDFRKQEAKMKAEYLAKIEKLSRDCNTLRKEKEDTVIRYANSEKEVIVNKKIQQELEKKIKDMTKDRECLLLKLKNASAENSKLSSSLENKMVEIAKLQKENEKLNADFNSREIRIKWLQNKLKTETSAHQETQTKLDHTLHRLNEMREEAEQVRKDCQEMIKCYQEDEEIKSVKLDSQLKEKLSELEVQKQEKCDQEQVYMLLRQELDALKKKQRLAIEDNNSLTLKINSLEKERLEYEQTLCKLKDNQNLLKEEIADLTSRLAEMEGLKLQLEQEREKSAATLREVERLRLTNAELQSDLDACHVKEGDRLDFVEKLTAKTMLLQSDHCLLEVKAQALEDEVSQLKKSLSELQQNYEKSIAKHEDSKKEHENEMQLLVQKLAEKAKTVEKLNTRLEEAENENRVLKRRHIASIKELSRELYQCKRRLESYESNGSVRAESVSLGSRTSSSASLHVSNSNDLCQNSSPSVTFSGKNETPSHQKKNGSPENQFTVDKEVLIDRILNLQKMLAKKTDKIDFLEDHIEQLVREMRKKSKTVDFKNV